MPKFKIHLFEEVRRTYEVVADTIEAAAAMTDDPTFDFDDWVDSDRTYTYSPSFVVDPILENGEVDYDNYKWFGVDE